MGNVVISIMCVLTAHEEDDGFKIRKSELVPARNPINAPETPLTQRSEVFSFFIVHEMGEVGTLMIELCTRIPKQFLADDNLWDNTIYLYLRVGEVSSFHPMSIFENLNPDRACFVLPLLKTVSRKPSVLA